MAGIKIGKDPSNRIKVFFPYDPIQVEKIGTIEDYRWHLDTEGTLEKILETFRGEEIDLAPSLQSQFSHLIISRRKSGERPAYILEDLRRELLSRKYSYKTLRLRGFWLSARGGISAPDADIIPFWKYIRT